MASSAECPAHLKLPLVHSYRSIMEEDHLLKERFQAITDKKKVQNDIAVKRMEIDKEKLKFQYLKKKVVREQWLMEGQTAPSGQGWEVSRPQVEEQQEQIRTLQSSIYRMEREVEALERQEIIISMNEGFILKRLKAVEKSPEDIIKAAKSGEEGAVYAMEINLQEDKGTGESPALSTGTIRPQWAQWNGVNIKDEGRSSARRDGGIKQREKGPRW